MRSCRKPGLPGFVFVGFLLALAAGCGPHPDWREHRAPELGFIVALPDKPQTVAREVDYGGPGGPLKLPMTMVSTGVGPSLFAVGVAALPPAALAAPAELDAAVGWFREALLRNVQGRQTAAGTVTLAVPPGRKWRTAQTLRASARAGRDGAPAVLAARFVVVDDRLYQLVALGAESQLTAAVLDTFFDSFRLLP